MAVSKESVLNSLATFKSLQDAANADKFVAKENYSEFKGATSTTDGESGLVVKPTAGDADKFLRGDGTWAKANVTVIQGGDSGIIIDGKPGIQGALWQALTDDGTPCLKLRYNDYEYNFRYDEIKSVGTVTPVLETPEEIIYTLGTTPETVDGSLWYEVRDTGTPILKVHRGTFDYGYLYDTITYKGGNTNLISYMPLQTSTDDAFSTITWTVKNTPTFEVTPLESRAWRLNTTTLTAGDAPLTGAHTIDFWFYPVQTSSSSTGMIFQCAATYTTASVGSPKLIVSSGAFSISNKSADSYIQMGAFNHCAYVYDGTKTTAYINGKQVWQFATRIKSFVLGDTASNNLTVYMNRFRMFTQALWVEDFTPPTAEDYL